MFNLNLMNKGDFLDIVSNYSGLPYSITVDGENARIDFFTNPKRTPHFIALVGGKVVSDCFDYSRDIPLQKQLLKTYLCSFGFDKIKKVPQWWDK